MWRYTVPHSNSTSETESVTQKATTIAFSAIMIIAIVATMLIMICDRAFVKYTEVHGVVSDKYSYTLPHTSIPVCTVTIETPLGTGVMQTSCNSPAQIGSSVRVKVATTRFFSQLIFSE